MVQLRYTEQAHTHTHWVRFRGDRKGEESKGKEREGKEREGEGREGEEREGNEGAKAK